MHTTRGAVTFGGMLRCGLIMLVCTVTFGCVPIGVTGFVNWIEERYQSNRDRRDTFKTAKLVLAQIGQVTHSDPDIGAINGGCSQGVDASLLITAKNGGSAVVIKSRVNEKGTTWAGARHREKCIEQIAAEMTSAGVTLTKQ